LGFPVFVLREALTSDLDAIHQVASHLDTVNLPDDRELLEKVLDLSRRSFGGQVDPFKREYLFILEDRDGGGRLAGTCMIHAQHGTRRAPHIYFEVLEDERYSETLDRHFTHRILRIGYNYAGPTEIGGLVLDPHYRGGQAVRGLGKFLSYTRFLYIAMHRDRFRDEVLSELLPPLETDGKSLLWEALGRHFTGLTYQEADRISKENKEFIRTLFPQVPIYTTLLPAEAQALIGHVGPETRGVEAMLRKIGFTYANRIDPFDGGPHFIAHTDDVSLVKATVRGKVVAVDAPTEGRPMVIVGADAREAPHFRAVMTPAWIEGGQIGLPPAARQALEVEPGDEVAAVAMP
jgi:arginine N-succinyltransferase